MAKSAENYPYFFGHLGRPWVETRNWLSHSKKDESEESSCARGPFFDTTADQLAKSFCESRELSRLDGGSFPQKRMGFCPIVIFATPTAATKPRRCSGKRKGTGTERAMLPRTATEQEETDVHRQAKNKDMCQSDLWLCAKNVFPKAVTRSAVMSSYYQHVLGVSDAVPMSKPQTAAFA